MDEPIRVRPMAATLLTQAALRSCVFAAVLVAAAAVLDADLESEWPWAAVTAVAWAIFATVDRGEPELPADGLSSPPAGAENLGLRIPSEMAAMTWLAVALFAVVVAAERLLGGGGLAALGAILGSALVEAVEGLRVLRWQRRHGGTVLERVEHPPAGEPRTFAV